MPDLKWAYLADAAAEAAAEDFQLLQFLALRHARCLHLEPTPVFRGSSLHVGPPTVKYTLSALNPGIL